MDCGIFATSYKDDMAVLFHPGARVKIVIILLALAVLPYFANSYYVSLANLIGIAVIGALGLNILTGFTGQMSLGHGAFMAVGAYTTGILVTKMGVPLLAALPVAGAMGAITGAVFGIPLLRLKGLYLAIATLAVQVIIEFIIVHWVSLTNGTAGIVLPAPVVFGHSLDNDVAYYYFILILCLVTVVFTLNLFRTRPGRALMAVRDRELAAAVMGVNVFQYKLTAFALASFYAGISGALWGAYMQVVSPEHFTVTVSILYLAMVVIGGLGSVMGSIYGACFITLLPILIRETASGVSLFLPWIGNTVLALHEAIFGLIIILFLIFEPKGLAKLWQNIKNYFKLWPFAH